MNNVAESLMERVTPVTVTVRLAHLQRLADVCACTGWTRSKIVRYLIDRMNDQEIINAAVAEAIEEEGQ